MSKVPSLQGKLILCASVNIVPDRYDQWQAAYDELEKYVWAEEPGSLAYQFGIPLEHADNPSRTDLFFAFEMYGSRKDLYETHLTSSVITEQFFPKAMPAMATGLDIAHFSAIGGFLDYSGAKAAAGIMQDIQIRTKDAVARQEVLHSLQALCRAVEEAQKTSNDVWTYLGLLNEDNETGLRIFARYRDRRAMEAWQRRPEVTGFWEGVKPAVVEMASRAYVPNGKGWLWR